MLTGSNFIGSRESREAPGGLRARDPSTGAALEPSFAEATLAEVDAAARAAQAAFEAYAALPPARRAAFLRALLGAARSSGHGPNAATEAQPALLLADAASFVAHDRLGEEIYGPVTLAVRCGPKEELLAAAQRLRGHLTATVHATERDLAAYGELLPILARKAGRVVLNGVPTGVEVTHAMQHGGPWPATTDARATSVGTTAILRFARPLCYQGFPDAALPEELRGPNPRGIWRRVDGRLTRDLL